MIQRDVEGMVALGCQGIAEVELRNIDLQNICYVYLDRIMRVFDIYSGCIMRNDSSPRRPRCCDKLGEIRIFNDWTSLAQI